MRTEYQEQAKVFKALCDPKRLSILEQLRSGEKCACVLQEPLDLTQSGLSYHIPGHRGKTHLSKVRIKNAIYKEKDGVF